MLFPPPLVLVLGVGFGGVGAPGGLEAWTSYVTPAAIWDPSALPLGVGVVDAPALPGVTPSELDAALFLGGRAWMSPSCTAASFRVVAAHAPKGDPSSLLADGENDVIVHTTDWPAALEAGAVAHTVVYLSGGRIVEADVHLNAKDWTFATSAGGKGRDLRSVLTHELGHVLGIGHSEVSRATMAAGLPAGLAGRTLEPDDLAAACALYPLAPPVAHGCDHDGVACPGTFVCVGRACEQAGELGVLGASCSTSSPRCDGASDAAYCLSTSSGERCVAPCPAPGAPEESCGSGLTCVSTDADGHRACVPIGTTVLIGDAGPDAAPVADADAAGQAAPAANDGGCVVAAAAPRAPRILLFAVVAGCVAIATGRRRRRTRARRGRKD